MRVGVCGWIDQLGALERAGFDYLEPPLSRVAGLSADEFGVTEAVIDRSPLKAEAFNCFLPGDLRVTGAEVDWKRIRAYLTVALARARRLGGQVIVFGSGGARNRDEATSRERAKEQLAAFLTLASELCEPHGLTIAIEPLRPAESNIINTVAEGCALARRIDRHNIRVLADFYHMCEQQEGEGEILAAGRDFLRHVHLASPGARRYPLPADAAIYRPFFRALQQIGYAGRVSIEAGSDNLAHDLPAARELLRELDPPPVGAGRG